MNTAYLIRKPNTSGTARFLLDRIVFSPLEEEYKPIDGPTTRKSDTLYLQVILENPREVGQNVLVQ